MSLVLFTIIYNPGTVNMVYWQTECMFLSSPENTVYGTVHFPKMYNTEYGTK
jgi:hypothetical protein